MLLNESKRDDFLNSYVELLKSKGIETTLSQLKSYLLSKFSAEFGIYALSKPSNLYLSGVARYYFEGLLTSNKRLNVFYSNVTDKPIREICTRLNALIEILRNAYIDSIGTQFEQPEDFGTLPLDKLLKKYNKKINIELGIVDKKPKKEEEDVPKIDKSTKASKNYTYEIIYDYPQVQKFNDYTKPGAWCITYGQQHYNSYIKRLGIHYVVFMKKGFENVERKVGKGFTKEKPHDEYGNSLICVLQSNKDPRPIYITSRWNHGYGETQGTEADHAYTTEEFLNVVGCDYSVLERCFAQWQEGVKQQKKKDENGLSRDEKSKLKLTMTREFKYLQMQIAHGANLKDELLKRKSPHAYLLDSQFKGSDPFNKKTPLLVGLKNEDTNLIFWTIFDRGVFLVDKVLFNDLGYRPETVGEGLAIIQARDIAKHYIYNTKRHFLLNADGNYGFKAAPSRWECESLMRDNRRYFMVANTTNQYSIVDKIKGDILKAPNGATVFESITVVQSGARRSYVKENKINLSNIPNSGKLYLIYDSAANHNFLFDLSTDKFVRCYDGLKIDDGITLRLADFYNGKFLEGYTLYEYRKRISYRAEGYVAISDSTGEKLALMGETVFAHLIYTDGVIAFRPLKEERSAAGFQDECYYYDTKTNNYLKINGELVFGRCMYSYESGFVIISSRIGWSSCYLYNTYTHDFFNYNGEYIFDVKGAGKGNMYSPIPTIAVSPKNNEKKELDINAQEIANTMQESVKKDFYNIFGKLF